MCTGDLVKQGLFQLHVPGTNRATPARFCPQVRLHYPLSERSSPTLVWAASVGGDTETGARLPGERPPKPQPRPLMAPEGSQG